MKCLSVVWTGKYYLVDSGYPNSLGYLSPYLGEDVRYHLPEFISGIECNNGPQGMKELFNYRHSCLRGVIERTFGMLKQTWKIVADRMPQMSLNSQIEIVVAVCTLHSFMQLHEQGIDISPRPPNTNRAPYVGLFDTELKRAMNNFLHQIATAIAESCWNCITLTYCTSCRIY